MEHTELKINSVILSGGNEKSVTRSFIYSGDISQCEPIKVDKWMCERCRLDKRTETTYFLFGKNSSADIYIDIESGQVYIEECHSVECRYFHQLQMLYYALTGVDLIPNAI